MSVEPARGGTAPWWPPAPPPTSPSHESPLPSAAAPTGAGLSAARPVASAALGGIALLIGAAGFFLPSTAMVISVLASIALASAIGGVVLGAWSLRRPAGEVGVIGVVAGGLALPLATFDLLVAVTGQLR